MAKGKKDKKELTGEEQLMQMSPKEIYDKAKKNISIAKVMGDIELKVGAYKKALELLSYISDNFDEQTPLCKADDSERDDDASTEGKQLLAVEEAKKLYAQVESEMRCDCAGLIVTLFKKAHVDFENARTFNSVNDAQKQFTYIEECLKKYIFQYEKLPEELQKEIDQCRKAKEYKYECGRRLEKMSSRKSAGKGIFLFVVIVLAVVVIGLSRTSIPRYCLAVIEEKAGMEERACQDYYQVYEDSGDEAYLEKYMSLAYKIASEAYDLGDVDIAYSYFKVLGKENYKDSEEKFAETERYLIARSECGDKVHFGDRNWIVVNKDNGECTLVGTKLAANNFRFSVKGGTWDTSDAREYLNSEFLDNVFTMAERENIALTSVSAERNDEYGTSAGEDTEDKVFILSASQINEYSRYLEDIDAAMWLRTPGAYEGTTAFTKKNVAMKYGYDSSANAYGLRPTICVVLPDA